MNRRYVAISSYNRIQTKGYRFFCDECIAAVDKGKGFLKALQIFFAAIALLFVVLAFISPFVK